MKSKRFTQLVCGRVFKHPLSLTTNERKWQHRNENDIDVLTPFKIEKEEIITSVRSDDN